MATFSPGPCGEFHDPSGLFLGTPLPGYLPAAPSAATTTSMAWGKLDLQGKDGRERNWNG